MSDEYRTVTCQVRQLRIDSIMIEVPSRQGWQSIPRSCIHGGDERRMVAKQHSIPCEMTFRIVAWKADQLGLA
mgnify:CR=1 FL=1